jgi:hypothetical protein
VENERYTKAFWDTIVGTDRPYREDTARFEAFGQEPVNIGMSELDAPPSWLYHIEGYMLFIGGNIQISRIEIGSEQGHLRA